MVLVVVHLKYTTSTSDHFAHSPNLFHPFCCYRCTTDIKSITLTKLEALGCSKRRVSDCQSCTVPENEICGRFKSATVNTSFNALKLKFNVF